MRIRACESSFETFGLFLDIKYKYSSRHLSFLLASYLLPTWPPEKVAIEPRLQHTHFKPHNMQKMSSLSQKSNYFLDPKFELLQASNTVNTCLEQVRLILLTWFLLLLRLALLARVPYNLTRLMRLMRVQLLPWNFEHLVINLGSPPSFIVIVGHLINGLRHVRPALEQQ